MTVRQNICTQPSARRPNSQHKKDPARDRCGRISDGAYTRSRVYVCDGRDKYGAARLIGRQVERASNFERHKYTGREHEARAEAMRVRQLVRRYSAHTAAHSTAVCIFEERDISSDDVRELPSPSAIDA